MPKAKLTAPTVANLKPAADRFEVWDLTLPSFGVRVTPSGRRSWIVAIRKPGAKHPSRIKIGEYPAMGLAEARAAAREMMADPGGERQPPVTVAEVVADYIRLDQRPHRKAWQHVEAILKRELAAWADRPIDSITRKDGVALVNAIVARGSPVAARQALAHTKRLFAWCIEQEILEDSPAASVKAPGKVPKRDHVLSLDEMRALWRACGPLGWPSGAIVRLLLLTGLRRGEVAGLRWTEIVGDTLVFPGERMKGGRRHVVPLSPPAVELITGLPRMHGEIVFPGRDGTAPIKNLNKARLDDLSGVTGWVVHDLRRSVATELGRLGYSRDVIGAVLAHAAQGVTAVYARYDFELEKRQALEAWAECFTQ